MGGCRAPHPKPAFDVAPRQTSSQDDIAESVPMALQDHGYNLRDGTNNAVVRKPKKTLDSSLKGVHILPLYLSMPSMSGCSPASVPN